ncbi:FMN-dependent oxidoreductase, nitrilotriacetate monooxygenase family [Rathayibacter oskolensis]|uniref:FMN-dependent oxidoreductase, nitrilotriacetate monooxygenase family n=1 Tax=Rathayibacter oskolensis TaxID=1891671 RepID=A0A1X7NZB7_9MICO|nr:NtaA/DmoA family FMN-dependent monooxygenase [Rathayibacter oskolensis]SMH43204.1 FMN-dependent oxidoreductase, nitrilotriacetate monooxygenase family [Rathayibacter oskolensis]
MFHLAWFLGDGFGIHAWSSTNGDGPWAGNGATEWMKPGIHIDLATSLERAGFDYILIEDTAMVEDSYNGSADTSLRRGFMAPKNDPMPLVPLMTQATKHIGIVPTVSTIQYPPYLAARLFTTLDHLTEGRVGMNVVTSVTDRVAQNFGYERHLEHDERYTMAMEWTEVVQQLQTSWKPGAVIADGEAGIYADHTKVEPIDFEGTYFRSRGPLNTIPGPQGLVPVCSAGSSPAGRELAAKYDDTMISMVKTGALGRAYREDMRRRVAEFGRDPDTVKFMFLINPVLGATDAEARAAADAYAEYRRSDKGIEYNLWNMSYTSGGRIDFGGIDPDTLIRDIDLSKQNGEHTSILELFRGYEDRTLREAVTESHQVSDMGLVGSPDTVAAKMGELMDEIGGDGFLVYMPTTRVNMAMVADGLAPALRRRGLIREEYTGGTLRDNLLQF